MRPPTPPARALTRLADVVGEAGDDAPVWPVSAAPALAGDDADGRWSAFRTAFSQTLRRHGNSDLHQSVRMRAHGLAAAVGERELATLAALTLSEQAMDGRLETFEAQPARIDQVRFASAAMVRAHVDRLRAQTDAQAAALPPATAPGVLAGVQEQLQHDPGPARRMEDAALSVAAEQIERVVDDWRTRRARESDQALQELVREASEQVDGQVTAAGAVAAELFGLGLELTRLPDVLSRSARFWYAFGDDPGQTQALAGAVRRKLPGSLGRRRTQRYVRQRTVELLAQQAGRARADLDQRLRETRRMLLTGLEQRFDDGAGHIADALRRGDQRRRSGSADLDAARETSRGRWALATALAADLAANDPARNGAA